MQHTHLFFEGKNDELIDRLTASMRDAAAAERFEEAAHLRDAARTVQTLRDRQQKIATVRLGDRDAFGLHMGPAGAVVHVFVMRGGKVLERVELAANEGISGTAAEILQASVEQFYEDRPAPAEVHLSSEPEDAELLEAWLSARAERRVQVLVPKRGDKRGLVELAVRNARIAYQARLIDTGLSQYDALETLRSTLALPAIPRRIECFDISTIQGSETVASMVVCEDGKMRKSDYRKYRISPANHAGSDDFAAMNEVVTRRYRKLLEQGGPFPDLILIDGGKGQLSAAYDALQQLGLANLIAVGIAKKEELLYTRDREEPIAFEKDDPALRLVQQIRDEAHRFAVTFHRKARAMRDLRSELDSVPGRGAAPEEGVARRVRQPRRRAPRVSRRADGRRRRENGRCGARILRRQGAVTGYTLYPLLPDLNVPALVIAFLVLIFSLSVHEAAHAWSASQLGDDTAKRLGRVTLNPVVHVDPIGTLLLPLIAMVSGAPLIGWAKPTPVNTRNLRTSEARSHSRDGCRADQQPADRVRRRGGDARGCDVGRRLAGHCSCIEALTLNVLLAVFNMLPIPPLDGGQILMALLPPRVAMRLGFLYRVRVSDPDGPARHRRAVAI